MEIPITILNASFCIVPKNIKIYNVLWEILSFNYTYQHFGELVTNKISLFDKKMGLFGTGLLEFIKYKLSEKDIDYTITKNFKFPYLEINKNEITLPNKTLEDYQIKVIKELNNKNITRGIIHSPTASGKTTIMAGFIKKLNIPKTLIICPTRDIARNTQKSLKKDLEQNVGFLGDGEKNIQHITVSLYQTLRNMDLKQINKSFNMVLIDEGHMALDAIRKILEKFHDIHYRFGFSATAIPKVKKQQYFKVTSQIGPVIKKITEKQSGTRIINEVEAYMFEFKTDAVNKDWKDIYRYDVLLNERRCMRICEMVNFALKEKKVKNILTLVDELDQANMIKEIANFIDIPKPVIAWSGANNLNIIKRKLNNYKIPWCIATTVFSVGTDIPEIECIILGSARKSITNTIQKIGRGRRKTINKKKLLLLDLYDIVDGNNKFEQYSQRRMNIYKRKKWMKEIIPYGKKSNT